MSSAAKTSKKAATLLFARYAPVNLEPKNSIGAKWPRLLAQLPLAEIVGGRRTAIKMHLGGGSGFTPPSFNGTGGGFAFRFGGFNSTLTQLHTSVGWSTLVFAFLAAIVIAVLGSSVATATIARIRPADVLRSE